MGYSLQAHKESDTTEVLSLHTHLLPHSPQLLITPLTQCSHLSIGHRSLVYMERM